LVLAYIGASPLLYPASDWKKRLVETNALIEEPLVRVPGGLLATRKLARNGLGEVTGDLLEADTFLVKGPTSQARIDQLPRRMHVI